jgi:hypothetical protein
MTVPAALAIWRLAEIGEVEGDSINEIIAHFY